MGFFGKIFGSSKPKEVGLQVGEAQTFLEKELSQKRKQVFDDSAKKIAEIKHLLRETRASLKRLESAEAKAKTNRIDKIVETAKSNAMRQISSLLEKLEPPNASDLAAIRQYCTDSLDTLRQSGTFGKNVAYAGISFKDEMKELGNNMKVLSQTFSGLQNLLDQNKAVFMQGLVKEKLSRISELYQSLVSFEKDLVSLQKALEKASLERSRLESSLNSLRESEAFKEIDSLNWEKASLLRDKQNTKTELLDLFATVEKPLHRLDKAVNARKVFLPGKQAELLHDFLQNPFIALKKDPKAETLKLILTEAAKAIMSGKIDLKERDREKKLALLQELMSFDFFSEGFWKFNKIDSGIIAIEKKLNELPALKKEAELSSSLKQAQAKEAGAREEIASKKSQIQAAKNSIAKEKALAQHLLSQATGKTVSFKD